MAFLCECRIWLHIVVQKPQQIIWRNYYCLSPVMLKIQHIGTLLIWLSTTCTCSGRKIILLYVSNWYNIKNEIGARDQICISLVIPSLDDALFPSIIINCNCNLIKLNQTQFLDQDMFLLTTGWLSIFHCQVNILQCKETCYNINLQVSELCFYNTPYSTILHQQKQDIISKCRQPLFSEMDFEDQRDSLQTFLTRGNI
jgi:hypothetical protein